MREHDNEHGCIHPECRNGYVWGTGGIGQEPCPLCHPKK